MRLITRTVYGSALQTSKHLGIEHPIVNNSSLNQALDNFTVAAVNVIVAGQKPQLHTTPINLTAAPISNDNAYNPAIDTTSMKQRYFAIGNGGHKNFTGADSMPYTAPLPHRATDAGLYKWLPFVIRPKTNDLPNGNAELQKGQYRMRRVINIGGTEYIAYFLKLLDLDGVTTEMQRVNVVSGTPQSPVAFVPSTIDLQPTAPNVTSPGVFPNDGSYLTTTAAVEVQFTAAEIDELKNVVTILQGNELYAIISEIALCSGVDKEADGFSWTGAAWEQTFSYSEAMGVQINTHISAYYPVAFTNAGFNFRMNLGATEPLFGASAP